MMFEILVILMVKHLTILRKHTIDQLINQVVTSLRKQLQQGV